MASRLKLHEEFCEILGNRNVYFQPPSSVKMQYPAIVYSRKNIETTFASNGVYKQSPSYEAILIDKNPDSGFIEKILLISHCRYERHYAADNLNHDVFTIYNY